VDQDVAGCHGSKPGCRNPPIKEDRAKFLHWVDRQKVKNPTIKMNLSALDVVCRIGNMCFRQHAFHTEAALMNTEIRLSRLRKIQNYFSEIPDTLEKHTTNLYGMTLSRDQAKLICDWVEDEFLVVLPMGVMKKMLMASIALGFLIKRLVPKGDKKVMRMIFHAVFNKSLVRNSNKGRYISDEHFLNGIFPK